MLCSINLILIYSSMWLWFTFILYIKYATVINSIYRHISLNRTSCVWLSALLAASSCGSVAIQPEVKTNRRSTTFQWSNTAEAVFQFSACHLAMFPPTNCQGTSSARVATITRAMLTIMENEILNFLKRRSRRSKNKVKPGNPKTNERNMDTNGRLCWAKCCLEEWSAGLQHSNGPNGHVDQQIIHRIAKLCLHWSAPALASVFSRKEMPMAHAHSLYWEQSTQLQFSAASGPQRRSSPYTVRYADLPNIPKQESKHQRCFLGNTIEKRRSLGLPNNLQSSRLS